jgi:type IV pilus assembly protein PilB
MGDPTLGLKQTYDVAKQPPAIDEDATFDPAAVLDDDQTYDPAERLPPATDGAAAQAASSLAESVPEDVRDNPVVAKLLAEAARRQALTEDGGTEFLSASAAPALLDDETIADPWVPPQQPDDAQTTDTAERAPAPLPAMQDERPVRSTSDDPARYGGESRLLRGLARSLVDGGALSERRAVSLAMQARDGGVGFMRALASDRASVDLFAIYKVIGELVGSDPIATRNEAVQRMTDAEWLPAEMAEQWQILPLATEDDETITLAAVDPFDIIARDWARARAGVEKVNVTPIHPDVFFDSLGRYHSLQEENSEADGMFTPISVNWSKDDIEHADLTHMDIPAAVDFILHTGFELGASDMHIEPTADGLVVRCRVDGVLREEVKLPRDTASMIASRIKVMANLDVAERRKPQDGRIGVAIQGHPIDVRVSSLPTVNGEKMVLRLLDEGSLRPRIEDIGLTDREMRTLADKISAPYGLILLSGPTGSGKTTTLYSCLAGIDRIGRNVVTVEDPVEYRLKGVHQTQVDENIGLTFSGGLRAMLRQDPDVIMVGECRDKVTAQMAVQASLTGHLVFSTIHANDAVGVASRLMDMEIDPFLIANSVSMTLAQRLLRVHCPHCQTVVDGREVLSNLRAEGVGSYKLERLGISIAPDMPCIVTLGCGHCRHTGYVGRQAVFELLALDDETRGAIMTNHFDLHEFRRVARSGGMQSMFEHALILVEEGRTSYSEIIRVLGES